MKLIIILFILFRIIEIYFIYFYKVIIIPILNLIIDIYLLKKMSIWNEYKKIEIIKNKVDGIIYKVKNKKIGNYLAIEEINKKKIWIK